MEWPIVMNLGQPIQCLTDINIKIYLLNLYNGMAYSYEFGPVHLIFNIFQFQNTNIEPPVVFVCVVWFYGTLTQLRSYGTEIGMMIFG
jgi:hypothetical protein